MSLEGGELLLILAFLCLRVVRAVGNPERFLLAFELGQRTRRQWGFLLLFAGIRACLGTCLVARYADIAAVSSGLFVLVSPEVGLTGPRETTVDFLEGLRDLDRVLHEPGEVSIEIVVQEADVLFEACP